jgi:hypothetical protein
VKAQTQQIEERVATQSAKIEELMASTAEMKAEMRAERRAEFAELIGMLRQEKQAKAPARKRKAVKRKTLATADGGVRKKAAARK